LKDAKVNLQNSAVAAAVASSPHQSKQNKTPSKEAERMLILNFEF
jgi:hypothetical protein